MRTFEEILDDIVVRYRTAEASPTEAVIHEDGVDAPPTVTLSIAPMSAKELWQGQVDVHRLADFLTAAGDALVKAGIPDMQHWLQHRMHKGRRKNEEVAVFGVIIDIDKLANDVFEAIKEAGVPMPTAYWQTRHGFKLAYAFDRALEEEEARAIANWLILAIDGGDPASADPAQGQHLPVVLKSTEDGVVDVRFEVVQGNPVPFRFEDFALDTLPRSLTRILGGRPSLTDDERDIVKAYLDSKNLNPPDEPGDKRLYAACPECEAHDTTKCYVNRALDGSLSVRCNGGHDGRGPLSWSEHALFSMAVGGSHIDSHSFDPIRDVPATWAGKEYRAFRAEKGFNVSKFAKQLVDIAEEVWVEAWARVEQEFLGHAARRESQNSHGVELDRCDLPSVEQLKRLYRERLRGYLRMKATRMFFDAKARDLGILQPDGRCCRVLTKSSTLSLRNHSHEWHSTTAFGAVPAISDRKEIDADGVERTEKIATFVMKFDPRFTSLFNKALAGNTAALSALGLPLVTSHIFPIAFVEPSWELDPVTKIVTGVRIPCPLRGNPDFDVVGFFKSLFREGRLPLATEQDVLRLLMAISAPLLRGLAPGQLGIFWMIGPPGAGKDFLADLIIEIWGASINYFHPKASFDLSMTDDLEMKRTFYAAHPAVIARAKEAGKRRDMVERLIQFAGTAAVPARGMRLDEIAVANDFTFIADSAEDLPERKEISRRTVVISVADMDDAISKGAVMAEVKRRAADILAALKALVESKPVEWYLDQTDTKSRPVVPVALAKLFGAQLAEVEGRDLSDLFEAMSFYAFHDVYRKPGDSTEVRPAEEEAASQMTTAREKDGREAKLLRNYRFVHLVDTLSRHDQFGYKALFKEFPSCRSLHNALLRETEYRRVDQKALPYLRVEIGSEKYAFKLVKNRRNFILCREEAFKKALAAESGEIAPPVKVEPAPSSSPSDYDFDAPDDGKAVA